MSEPADAAKPHIPATVIPQLAAAAAQIAATHAEPSPASIAAVATTRAKALDVVGKGTKIPGSESVPVYAVVMTGHFISHRGGPPSPPNSCARALSSQVKAPMDAAVLGRPTTEAAGRDEGPGLPGLRSARRYRQGTEALRRVPDPEAEAMHHGLRHPGELLGHALQELRGRPQPDLHGGLHARAPSACQVLRDDLQPPREAGTTASWGDRPRILAHRGVRQVGLPCGRGYARCARWR